MTWPPSYRFIQAVVNWWWMPLHRIPRRSSSGRMEKDSGALEALSFFVQKRWAVCGKHMDMLWTICISIYIHIRLYLCISMSLDAMRLMWPLPLVQHMQTLMLVMLEVFPAAVEPVLHRCLREPWRGTMAGVDWRWWIIYKFTKIQDLRHPTSCRR